MWRRVGLAFFVVLAVMGTHRAAAGAEILWDDWGVPHIYAQTEADLMSAWGWAQMHSHGSLLLEQIGIVRGRAAEYWGEAYLDSDRYVWTMGLPRLAARLAATDPGDSSFADGMNAYAAEHPDAFPEALRAALPITMEDILALALYDEFFNGMVVTPQSMAGLRDAFLAGEAVRDVTPDRGDKGSNGWAIGPARSARGHALLLANPHAPWPSLQEARHLLLYEAHLVLPAMNVYGAGLVGLPVLSFGFNDRLAWTVTSAPVFDFVDSYVLTLADGGYLLDGRVVAFDRHDEILRVRQDDGTFREEAVQVLRSVHGPVLAVRGERALAVAFPEPGPEEAETPQFWRMMEATDLDSFLASLQDQNLFAVNLLYADREGHIAYVLSGIFPDRPEGPYDWSGTLPGDTSAALWRGKLPFAMMPVVIDPESGYLQSANEPPHYAAGPAPLQLEGAPADWPQPTAWPRTRRSLTLLEQSGTVSAEDVERLKFDTRSGLADAVLDTVLEVGRQAGSPQAQRAVEVLASWDRRFDSDSVGAVVFAFWAMSYDASILGGSPFPADAYAVPFDPADPLGTPHGLADPARAVAGLEFAARAVQDTFGTLQVPWGAFVGFRVGERAFQGFGAPPEAFGVFSPNFAAPTPQGPLATVAGDTWVAVIELGDPVTARAVLSYGNATQAGDPHVGDQLEIYAAKSLRPVWRDRTEIEAHLERREQR